MVMSYGQGNMIVMVLSKPYLSPFLFLTVDQLLLIPEFVNAPWELSSFYRSGCTIGFLMPQVLNDLDTL